MSSAQAGPRGRGLVYTALAIRSWWLVVPVVLALVLVLAPGLYAAAAVTHLRLRKRLDALAAFVIAVPSAVGAGAALLVIHAVAGWGGYLTAWTLLFVHQTVTAAALAAVLVAGAVTGPAAGGGVVEVRPVAPGAATGRRPRVAQGPGAVRVRAAGPAAAL